MYELGVGIAYSIPMIIVAIIISNRAKKGEKSKVLLIAITVFELATTIGGIYNGETRYLGPLISLALLVYCWIRHSSIDRLGN